MVLLTGNLVKETVSCGKKILPFTGNITFHIYLFFLEYFFSFIVRRVSNSLHIKASARTLVIVAKDSLLRKRTEKGREDQGQNKCKRREGGGGKGRIGSRHTSYKLFFSSELV